jgi:hypothetical protein
MFHIFNKVYIDFDDKINMSYDRIIISNEHGGISILDDLKNVFYGKVLATSRSVDQMFSDTGPYDSFLDLLIDVKTHGDANSWARPIYIYCDFASYYHIASRWLKLILPNANAEDGWKFFKSHIYKEKNFVNGRLSATQRFANNVSQSWALEESRFLVSWEDSNDDRSQYANFINSIKSKLRVEFLLASYLYDGRYAEELAICMSPLVKKDLEKFLYEHKEILLVHFQKPLFQQLLQVENGPYDFDNFYEMANDPCPMVEVMCRPEVWGDTKTSMYAPSAAGTINLRAFTPEDIPVLRQYSVVTGTVWTDEQWYTVLRSEIDKLDFIPFFAESDIMSVEDMRKVIDYEIHHHNHAAGAFYAIDLRTVNTYFVDHLLQNYQNKELLSKYVIDNV